MKEIDIYLDNKYSLKISVTVNSRSFAQSVAHKPDGEVVVDIERRTVMFSTHIAEYNIKFDNISIEHMAKSILTLNQR